MRKLFASIATDGVRFYLPDRKHTREVAKHCHHCACYEVPDDYTLPEHARRQEFGFTWVEFPSLDDYRYRYQ